VKVLITGAQGMLGTDLAVLLDSTCNVIRRDIQDFDITDKMQVLKEIGRVLPDVVINCAAYTNVDIAETEPEAAYAVNAEGVRHIAQACQQYGCLLYHISTDYVFDGKKGEPYTVEDAADPQSVYGKSKLAGERHVQTYLKKYVIIRTSWLYGKQGKNFVETIIRLAREKEELSVVNDQHGSPTSTVHLARAIKALLMLPSQGMYHFSNAGDCTWYDFALTIVRLLGYKTSVLPVTTQQFPRPAPRPQFSVMNCDKYITETGMHPACWQDALKEYLLNEKGRE